jgi:maltooligosyltrehalose synthase
MGKKARHVCAFARALEEKCAVIVAAVRMVALTVGAERLPVGEGVWGDTRVPVPDERPGGRYRDVFTGAVHVVDEQGGLWLRDVLSVLPVALLEREESAVP